MVMRSSAMRDTLTLVAVFALLLGGLWAYTGTWPPAVIVESSSMMHKECGPGESPPGCDPRVTYGRSWVTFGAPTIDPGDLVLVKRAKGVDDIQTLVEGGKEHHAKSGDVVIYYPRNDRAATPIIHRAVAYVEVVGTGDATQYRMRWNPATPCEGGATKDGNWCVYDSEGVYVPSVPIARPGSTPTSPIPYKPEHTGFLTKGDNPFTNRQIDQVSGLSQTVEIDWIEGKGRAELPWLGLIKLSLAGRPNEPNPPSEWTKIGSAYAPSDLWAMLGVTLFVLVGVPLIYDGAKAIRAKRTAAATYEAPPTAAAYEAPPAEPAYSDAPSREAGGSEAPATQSGNVDETQEP